VIKIDLNANAASKNDSGDPSAVIYSELLYRDNDERAVATSGDLYVQVKKH